MNFGTVARETVRQPKNKDTHEECRKDCGIGVFAFGEDTLSLRLASQLADLREGYANPVPSALWHERLFGNQKTRTLTRSVLVFWQRNRDSNPNIQSQSLLCYRYTIPLCPVWNGLYCSTKEIVCQGGFGKFFVQVKNIFPKPLDKQKSF